MIKFLNIYIKKFYLLDTDDKLDSVGAGAGALLCPLRIIDIGPFSSVAKTDKTIREQFAIILINLPGFCLATAANAIGAVGRIVDGDWMLLLLVLFANIWAADGWILLGVELINGLLAEEICEGAEAADVLLLLMLLLSDEPLLIISTFGRTAVGFITGWFKGKS